MAAVGRRIISAGVVAASLCAAGSALAGDLAYGTNSAPKPVTEDWYLTLGASGQLEPDYPGSDGYTVRPSLIFSISKASDLNTFRSVDDNPSIALLNAGPFSMGAVGRLDWGRDESDSDRLRGLGDIGVAVEAGGFAQWYALPWLRLRTELRYGVGGFSGLRGDLAADAIYTMDRWRFAVGPRLSYAGSGYMNTYYGVTPQQAAMAGLLGNPTPVYNAGGGFNLVGANAQLTYNFRNGFEAGLYGGYGYLLGDAGSSPLTSDRNQFLTGVSLSYTFNIGKAWW